MVDKDIKDYMKELIQKYDYYDPIKDRIESLKFAKIKNKKILDVGTGKGYVAILAAKNFKCDVTTIELFKEKLKLAKANAKKEGVDDKIRFIAGDAAKIPFQDDSFDAVISFNALHHSKGNFKNIIDEMFRVSKNKIIITELNEKGAKMFDEYIHPEENHSSMILDLNWLRRYLEEHSKLNVLERKLNYELADIETDIKLASL